MAIAKSPKRNSIEAEIKAEAFIKHAEQPVIAKEPNKEPTLIRIAPALRARIDAMAKRLGISRSAFIVQSAAEKLERME